MATATNSDYAAGMSIEGWVAANRSIDSTVFDNNCAPTIDFVQLKLHQLFVADHEGRKDYPIRVIGEFDNGYCKMPVFSIIYPGVVEIRICLQNPSVPWSWVASVKSEQPIDTDFRELFEQDKPADFDDFGDGWDHPQFKVDDEEFSLELDGEHELYTFCWLLTRELGINH